jgi:hypothetical protein
MTTLHQLMIERLKEIRDDREHAAQVSACARLLAEHPFIVAVLREYPQIALTADVDELRELAAILLDEFSVQR